MSNCLQQCRLSRCEKITNIHYHYVIEKALCSVDQRLLTEGEFQDDDYHARIQRDLPELVQLFEDENNTISGPSSARQRNAI